MRSNGLDKMGKLIKNAIELVLGDRVDGMDEVGQQQ